MKCQKCGTEYEANFCPNCGTPSAVQNNVEVQQPTTKKLGKKKRKSGCLIAVICVFVFAAVMGILFGEETPSSKEAQSNTNSTSNVQSEASSETDKTSSQEKTDEKKPANNDSGKVIYSDSDIRVSFIKVADASDYGMNLSACYIYLKVENTSSRTFTVTLQDAYANDSAVTVMSGLPMTLEPGKNSNQPFMFGYNQILNSADDVKKLEFKIGLIEENSATITKTEKITINVK